MLRLNSLADRSARYLLATAGPVGSAVAQFALTLVLLHRLDPPAFGSFSFLLIASQFSGSISGALLCAPLPVLITKGSIESRHDLLRCVMSASLIMSILIAAVFFLIEGSLGVEPLGRMLFAAFTGLASIRWFARAHAYAIGAPKRAILSDLVYAGVLLADVVISFAFDLDPFELACGAFLSGTVLGLIPFGRDFLNLQFLSFSLNNVRAYRAVWREHSKWSLLGVLTTEATANAHVYIVTLVEGPGAFAPLATSALMIRPITVAMNALSEFERAQLAHKIAADSLRNILISIRFFRAVLGAAWIATILIIILTFAYVPYAVFSKQYALNVLVTGSALWTVVAGLRAFRMPESVLLQAAGLFRPLALASVVSSVISIVGVAILLKGTGPLWSITGVIAGELVFAILIWKEAASWWKSTRQLAPASNISA